MVDITIQGDRVLFRVEKLIIQVADPAASAATLQAAMARRTSLSG